MSDFLPLTLQEAVDRGWDTLDFLCITGDAYVDHPSFGIAIISRVLESQGYRVGIIAQPVQDSDFTRFGRPRLGFMITSGNVDSMVSNYTAAKKRRSDDAYSPGGRAGGRPDRAVTVYCRTVRRLYGDIPIIIGGLEASLRRFAGYDYWDDTVHPSILVESGADLISYGMGEYQTIALARRLAAGEPVGSIRDLPGTCWMADSPEELPTEGAPVSCASFEKVAADKAVYARAFKAQMDEQDAVRGRTVIQKHGDRYLVQNPPMRPVEQQDLDWVYALPYQKMYHPSYEAVGGVPAIKEVEFSITHNRGCFGYCNFCSIAAHQGRQITCRSQQSVVREAEEMVRNPRFKGYIHDVGGPTANFRHPSCGKQLTQGLCKGKKCLAPRPCPNLTVSHREYLELLRKLRGLKGVKRVFIRSGIRFDYLLEDKDDSFLQELVEHHVSGQLKVAPEHCATPVLRRMGKPSIDVYNRFAKKFYAATKKAGKEQYLVPYLMSSHPGSTLAEAVELALYLKRNGIRPEQVQDFYPTPFTASTCMFYTGLDPDTMEPVYVPRSEEEKAMQRALLQYFKPENRRLVVKALLAAGRSDLIGNGPDCLVPPLTAVKREGRGKTAGQPSVKAPSAAPSRGRMSPSEFWQASRSQQSKAVGVGKRNSGSSRGQKRQKRGGR